MEKPEDIHQMLKQQSQEEYQKQLMQEKQGNAQKKEEAQQPKPKGKAKEGGSSKANSRAGNQKNTYIKKINTLIEKVNPMQEGQAQIPLEIESGANKVKRNKSLVNMGEINEEEKDKMKLARNRESARNSRKRKKIYLELLENKVTQLNDFLQESKEINKNSEELLNNLQSQILFKNEMQSQKQVLFRNMQMALQSNASQVNINGIIDSLKDKFGTVNNERMLVLDYCYKQIAEQMLPIHMQYILYACKYKKDIFEETPQNGSNQKGLNLNNEENEKKEEEGFPHIIKGLNFTDKQSTRCKKLQKNLTKEKAKMDQLLSQLYDAKEQMKDELKSLDRTFEELRTEFEPSLIGKFLMEIEKFQYNKNMKASFNKFFSAKSNDIQNIVDQSDDEEDLESDGNFYEFIKSEDSCNNLMVDINQAYDVYVDAYDFLSKKQQMQKEDKNQQPQ